MVATELIIHLFERFVWLDEGLQQRLHARGWPDVSRAQSMVMINVVTGTTRPSDIARRLGVSRQAIHGTIAQMVGKGIVMLVPDADDSRHKRLALTAFGEQMRHDAQEAMAALTDRVAGRIGTDRLAALVAALTAEWGAPDLP